MKKCLVLAGLATCSLSFGQFFQDNFETEVGSAGGTVLNGQNGWYLPSVGGVDGNVYTYGGNALGFPQHPNGGNQFAGAASPGNNNVRSQHDVNFASRTTWTMWVDFCFNYTGLPPGVNNLGSVSLQPSGASNYLQTLYAFGDVNNPTTYNCTFGAADAAGIAAFATFKSAGPEWNGLLFNHWYHQSISWDYTTNQITRTTLQDVTAGGSMFVYSPTDWYLSGGANNVMGQATATGVRLFVSGGLGNVGGYDNLSIVPEPATGIFALASLGAMVFRRRKR